MKYGESKYDNIILMVNSDSKYSSLNAKAFRSFLDFHGDIFVMFSGDPSSFVRTLAGYAGVEIDPKGSSVVDHFTAVPDASNIRHTKFQTTNYLKVFALPLGVICRFPVWWEIWPLALAPSPTKDTVCESTPTTCWRCPSSRATTRRPRFRAKAPARTRPEASR